MRAICSMLMAVGGLAVFFLGLCLPWFSLPTGIDSDGSLILSDAPATLWWKCGCLAVVGGTFVWLVFRKKREGLHSKLTSLFAAILPFLLLYPQYVTVMDEKVSGDSAWLQQQFDNLTWLGGDVYRGHSERPVPYGMGLWAQDPPNRLAAFRPPMAGVFSLGIAELPDFVWWMGYNPAFSQFSGRGWFLCVGGMLLLLIGSFSWGQRSDVGGQRKALMLSTAVSLCLSSIVAITMALIPVISGGRALRQAQAASTNWQARVALDRLEVACDRMPALRLDSGVIFQRGSLQRQLGWKGEPSARLYEAWLLSDKGYGVRSSLILDELLRNSKDIPVAIRREALRGLLREAVNDMNASRITEAKRKFKQLLGHEPVCLQAWFHYQLAALQTGDIEVNRLAAARIQVLTGSFFRKEKRGIVAASQAMLAQGEASAGNTEAAVSARRKSQGR